MNYLEWEGSIRINNSYYLLSDFFIARHCSSSLHLFAVSFNLGTVLKLDIIPKARYYLENILKLGIIPILYMRQLTLRERLCR